VAGSQVCRRGTPRRDNKQTSSGDGEAFLSYHLIRRALDSTVTTSSTSERRAHGARKEACGAASIETMSDDEYASFILVIFTSTICSLASAVECRDRFSSAYQAKLLWLFFVRARGLRRGLATR
jgi:hypothetical protein